jgi:hypothetical protein
LKCSLERIKVVDVNAAGGISKFVFVESKINDVYNILMERSSGIKRLNRKIGRAGKMKSSDGITTSGCLQRAVLRVLKCSLTQKAAPTPHLLRCSNHPLQDDGALVYTVISFKNLKRAPLMKDLTAISKSSHITLLKPPRASNVSLLMANAAPLTPKHRFIFLGKVGVG